MNAGAASWLARWAPWRRADALPARWVVLDVESTGLDPDRDRLVAVAAVAVHLRDGMPEVALSDSFETVLRGSHERGSARPADRADILVHGIGLGEMRAGRAPDEALRDFAAWAGDAPRLGFHVAFDRRLIERAERAHLGRAQPANWIDLADLAAVTHPQVRARALDEWLQHFRIPCLQRHRAIADALATAELLQHLWPRLRRETGGLPTPARLAKLADARRWT